MHTLPSAGPGVKNCRKLDIQQTGGPSTADIAQGLAGDIDCVHEGLTTAIWAGIHTKSTGSVPHYIEEAAQLRHFLG